MAKGPRKPNPRAGAKTGTTRTPRASPRTVSASTPTAPVLKAPGLVKRLMDRYRRNRAARKAGKKSGFIKKAGHAVVSHALKDAGHLGKHITKMFEDGGGVGGIPVNNASSGAVAGLGTSKDGSQGEPGVNKRKRKAPLLSYDLFKRKSYVANV